jgi:hypothetical protein
MLEGQTLTRLFLRPESQSEVGEEAYDKGAAILRAFFHEELRQFLEPDLHPLGREIIQCCMSDGSLADYERLIAYPVITNS